MCLTKGKPRFQFSRLVATLWDSRWPVHDLWRAFQISAAGLALVLPSSASAEVLPGLTYTNTRIASAPWSIHVVQVDRAAPEYQIQSIHARGVALGLDTLSDQLSLANPSLGTAVAAINGDFYQRDEAYAGAPRGLQIVDGELLSAPSGGASFWMDAMGQPHVENVTSRFQITWPDGTATAFGLNGERRADGVELYTPAIGSSTLTTGGRELILVQAEGSPWLPLRIGRTYTARVQEIRESGNTTLASNTMVVSIGPTELRQFLPQLRVGGILHISTASQPALRGIKTAISGGPELVRNGKRQPLNNTDSESYQVTSMLEQHPRTAIGWNEKYFFLVEVDGRQKRLSVGMTLEELSDWFIKLGCQEAMNFDGGGSATLWFEGQVRNSPCDRMEREIANCLVIIRKKR
jgi:hypothetical protein